MFILTGMPTILTRMIYEEDGQGLTEYAMLLVLIALLAFAAMTLLGGAVTNGMSTAASSL